MPAAALIIHPQRISASAESVSGSAANGYSPEQIRSAYRLPARGARGQTVAIIAAFNDPQIASDLAAYDRNFGLPGCTTANGCLSIHNEQGQATPLPQTDPTGQEWLVETSLDVEAVHGICESCKIAIYEANTPNSDDMSTAVNTAAKAGATVVVTTFQPSESSADTNYALDFSHQKTAVVSATGEALNQTYGYSGDVKFPSSLNYVTAVGGTNLKLGRRGGYGSETAWSDTVSGCSLFALAAPWQVADAQSVGCGEYRSVADLSADANPGMLVYASHLSVGGGPWFQTSGTSVAAPIIAAEIGLAGSLGAAETQEIYAHVGADHAVVHDITKGKTSPNCANKECQAAKGYDGPSGLGTPYGLGAFLKTGGGLPAGAPNLRLATGRTNAGRTWRFPLLVHSYIPVGVTGMLTIRARVGRRIETIASHKLSFGPLGGEPMWLTVHNWDRRALAHHKELVSVQMQVHGVGGRTGSVRRWLTVGFFG